MIKEGRRLRFTASSSNGSTRLLRTSTCSIRIWYSPYQTIPPLNPLQYCSLSIYFNRCLLQDFFLLINTSFFGTVPLVIQIIVSNCGMTDELERIRKDAIVTNRSTIPEMPPKTNENYELPRQTSRCPDQDSNREPSKYSSLASPPFPSA
jgi:hypothetical protein